MVSISRRKAVVHACWAGVMVRKNQSSVPFGLAMYPSSETLMARRTFLMFLLLLWGNTGARRKLGAPLPDLISSRLAAFRCVRASGASGSNDQSFEASRTGQHDRDPCRMATRDPAVLACGA